MSFFCYKIIILIQLYVLDQIRLDTLLMNSFSVKALKIQKQVIRTNKIRKKNCSISIPLTKCLPTSLKNIIKFTSVTKMTETTQYLLNYQNYVKIKEF